MSEPLLTVENLTVRYPGRRRRDTFTAVKEVSFTIGEGETVGLVGESGSGKSTIGRAILGLVPVRSGSIGFDGEDITTATFTQRRQISTRLQVIFQDPYGSLNPTLTIGQTLAEPVRVHEKASAAEIRERAGSLLDRIGLGAEALSRYPREFSGGQRQRIAIARSLMLSPKLIVCDEPVSALDLSIQAQILNLLTELQKSMGLSYLFISHDLSVVRYIADRLLVLRNGEVVESGDSESVFDSPSHDYTRSLLSAMTVL